MRTFQLTFYKEHNAFEIYKCDESGNPDTSHSFFSKDSFEWGFEWGDNWSDKLKIKWVPFGENTTHSLNFKPAKGYTSTRKSPIKEQESLSSIILSFDPKIENVLEFKKRHNDEAHWIFDFSWDSPGSGDSGSIDPSAKIKTPQ